ncbi:MAG: DUF3467 domain-containing protein [Planctomycetota bacterium]|jgi:hypothetical protein
MAKNDKENLPEDPKEKEEPVEEQARQQTGRRQVRLRVDERNMRTSYANGFRTNSMTDEVLIDFGLNLVMPVPEQQGQGEVVFHVSDRIILNYYSAKRLAIALSQIIRRHEEQFGELELDIAKRRKNNL